MAFPMNLILNLVFQINESLMRRLIFTTILVCLFSSMSIGQKKISFSKRKEMMEAAQLLFDDYQRVIKIGIIRDDTSSINGFRRLFEPDAKIYDDLGLDTAALYEDGKSFRFYKQGLRERSVDNYIQHNTLIFPNGSTATLRNLNFTFFKINSGVFKVIFEKESDGISNLSLRRPLVLKNLDTLEMTIQFDKNFANPLISGIERVGRKPTKAVAKASPKEDYFVCFNNKDCDDLPDQLDECPNIPGYDPFGCARKTAVHGFTVWGGAVFPRTSVSTLNQSQLGYGSLRNNISSYQDPSLAPKPLGAGLKLGAEYDIWFSKFQNIAFSFGLSYSLSRNTFTLASGYNVAFENQEQTNSQARFTQLVEVKLAEEVCTFHAISIPVLLKYSTRGSALKRTTYFGHAGVIIPVSLVSVSNSTYNAAYSSRYSFVSSQADNKFQSGEQVSTSDWVISEETAKQATSDEEIRNTYFQRKQLAGYNVSEEKKGIEKSNTNFRTPSVGIVFRLGLARKLGTRGRNFILAGEFTYSNNGLPAGGSNDGYFMTKSAISADYQALSSAMRNMNTWSVSAMAAYQWKFYKKPQKS